MKKTDRFTLKSKYLSICIASTGAFALSSPVFAQDHKTLEEVVVVAQKREQNLQDTPIAVSAFGETTLERLNVADLENLSGFVPNLRITSMSSDSTTASISLRGTYNNNPSDPGAENTVGMYVDGVYTGRANGALMDLADIQRVEVLRGPQGTLYGKNTIGGAINIITKRPDDHMGGKLKVTVGSDDELGTKGYFNFPALELGSGELRSRLSFLTHERDGFQENRAEGISPLASPIDGADEFGNKDRHAWGFVADWQVNEDLLISYTFDSAEIDQNGVYSQPYKANPAEGTFGAVIGAYAVDKRKTTGAHDYEDSFDKAEIDGHSLQIQWTINDQLTLKSITAAREVESAQGYDLDGTDVSLLHVTRFFEYETTTQELQLLGNMGSINWVTGLFYFNEEGDYSGYSQVFGAFGLPTRTNGTTLDNDTRAVYGQVDWQPEALPQLTLTVGGRYSEEDKDASRFSTSGGVFVVGPAKLDTLHFYEDTYMANALWAFNEEVNVYLKYSEGYRSGAYDGQNRDPIAHAIPYEPEYLKAVEFGMKSRWLENRLQVNLATFRSYYDDMLVKSYNTTQFTTVTDNAGEAEIDGIELEVQAQITSGLMLSLTYGYLDGDWKSYPITGSDGITVDYKDIAYFPAIQEHSYNIAIDYNFEPFSFGELAFHLDYGYADEFGAGALTGTNTLSPLGIVPDSEVMNARLSLAGIEMPHGTLDAAIWGKNITDQDNIRSSFNPGGLALVEWDDPARYGIEVTYRF